MASSTEAQIHLTMDEADARGMVAQIIIDHQSQLNILNTPLILALTSAVNSLRDNDRLRVVILTGAGDRAFIGGADIREMVGLDVASAREFISRLHLACAALRTLPVPVIARISGYCLGAGLEIAASCDLRVAADHATFGMPEVMCQHLSGHRIALVFRDRHEISVAIPSLDVLRSRYGRCI